MKAAYTIVGMKHRNAEAFVAALTAGESLRLIREPDNPHDPNAVQVWTRDKHIGFVKGTQASLQGLWTGTALAVRSWENWLSAAIAGQW